MENFLSGLTYISSRELERVAIGLQIREFFKQIRLLGIALFRQVAIGLQNENFLSFQVIFLYLEQQCINRITK